MSAAETTVAADRTAMEGLAEAMENAIDYIGNAGANAGASVKSAAGKTGEYVGAGAYKGAYGVSYGVVFSAVFLKELLPIGNVFRRGFEDGATAAFDAIENRKVAAVADTEEIDATPAPKPRATRRKTADAAEA